MTKRFIQVSLLVSIWITPLLAQSGDDLMKMIPADCVFCVRINNFDQALGQMDQFLLGVSPVNLSMMAKMQLGQKLGNPMLAGLKTDGSIGVFAVAPADGKDWANAVSILVPVSDYAQFVSSSSALGKPDADGICEVQGMGVFVANLGNYALVGPGEDAAKFAVRAKSAKAGPAKSITGKLDAAELAVAVKEPVWVYCDIQALSKVIGPGAGDKIRQAGAQMEQMQKGGANPSMKLKPVFDIYAQVAETFLKEGRSVVVALSPKPEALGILAQVTAMPGTEMAGLMTKAGANKDWTLLNYLEDGVSFTGAYRIDQTLMAKWNQKMLDMILPAMGSKVSQEQIAQVKTLLDDLKAAMGNEMAFSMATNGQSKPWFAVNYIFAVKDKDKFQKAMDRGMEMYGKDGLVSSIYSGMDLGMTTDVKQQADLTYQGVAIRASKVMFSSKDPNSSEAQMLQKMYGDGLEHRLAFVDKLAVMAIGADADANVKRLIDQVKAGGPKQMASEFKTAMDLLPEAKAADVVGTVNYLRMMAAMLPVMMHTPTPQMNLQSKSNLVFAGSLDKGKASLQVALPKEHLTEIMQVVQMMMMQGMQQRGGPGGRGPTPSELPPAERKTGN